MYYPGLEKSPYHDVAKAQFRGGLFGGMLSADLRGGEAGASAFVAALKLIKFAPSLAGPATTLSYPAKNSHRSITPEALAQAGISMGQLRFSIGLEAPEDIISDMDQAMEKI